MGEPGTPDLFGLLPGCTLWIEAKSTRGVMTPEQVAFREECRRLKIPHVVARSVDDIMPYLRAAREGKST